MDDLFDDAKDNILDKSITIREIHKIAISQCKDFMQPYYKLWNDAIFAVLEAIDKEVENA